MSKKAIKRILVAAITEAAEELDITYTQLLEELLVDTGTSSASENGTTTKPSSERPSEMAKSVAQLILTNPSSLKAKAYKLSLKTLNDSDRSWVILQLSNSPKIPTYLLDELMD
jgi:hypothetical protein